MANMVSYYSDIILMCLMALSVLCILVRENDRIGKKQKRIFYLTYAFIAASALAEWSGIQLTGKEDVPRQMLLAVKTADYILTPLAGGALTVQMKRRDHLFNALVCVLAGNTVFQLFAGFNGWMVIVDEHNNYTHGPLYPVYILVYVSVMTLVLAGAITYGKSFRNHNRGSLYAIMTLVIAGIIMQEVFGGDRRTAYTALTFGAVLMFIHYSEYSQLEQDDKISEQYIQITTDSLTGVLSRHAYSKALKDLSAPGGLPGDLAVFLIDVNGLKAVNDTLGHEAGDELICGAAACIEKAFGSDGKVFRIGGDEFVVFANMNRQRADDMLRRLDRVSGAWTGRKAKKLSLAAGYALSADHAGISPEQLAKEADNAMYKRKSAYYRENGIDRRRS